MSLKTSQGKGLEPVSPCKAHGKTLTCNITTFVLIKSQLCIKENLHTGTWKSDLHFEEDVSHDFKQNQTPDYLPVFSTVVLAKQWPHLCWRFAHTVQRQRCFNNSQQTPFQKGQRPSSFLLGLNSWWTRARKFFNHHLLLLIQKLLCVCVGVVGVCSKLKAS